MRYDVSTVEAYINALPDQQQVQVSKLREVIINNLPEGFEEVYLYDMITYVVPLKTYPPGYHARKNTPLPFLSIAGQKNSINIYHSGIYGDQKLFDWFNKQYHRVFNKKPDMGKSCIRFKIVDDKVLKLVGELSMKITPEEFIIQYESNKIKRSC